VFSREKSLLNKVIVIQNAMNAEVDLLSVQTLSSHKSFLQTLNLNVSRNQILKRKRATKNTDFAKRDRKLKISLEKISLEKISLEKISLEKISLEKISLETRKNENVKKRKTTQEMLITKNTQQNETQKNKERR
jgi:hypothetical protein